MVKNSKTDNNPELKTYTSQEASEALGVTYQTFRRHTLEADLSPVEVVGRSLIWDENAVETVRGRLKKTHSQ
jgi:hypothetical protein